MKIYIAGKMEWLNREDSIWRESLQFLRRNVAGGGSQHSICLFPNLELIFPNEQWFDHDGDLVSGIVEADLKALEESDGLIAVFTESIQVGTIVELMHALSLGKKCLAIFVNPTINYIIYSEWSNQHYAFLSKEISMRGQSDHYWFLINYLLKFTNATVAVARDGKAAVDAAGFWLLNLSGKVTP